MSVEGPPAVHQAVLRPSGRRFAAPAAQTLLRSAEQAGLAFASSCRNGTCRTCLRPLHAGRVHYRIAWPGLLPEERASGQWVLPCVAYPASDVEIGDPAFPPDPPSATGPPPVTPAGGLSQGPSWQAGLPPGNPAAGLSQDPSW